MVVLTFQLLLDCETVIFFFLSCFLSFIFFFVSFYRIFRRIFRFSPQSHSVLPPPPLLPPALCSRQEGTTICSRPFVRLFCVLGLRKKYGLFCGLKDFALIDVSVPGMETLAVILIELQMTG